MENVHWVIVSSWCGLASPAASCLSTQEVETGASVDAYVVMTRWKGVEANMLVAQTSLGHAQSLVGLLHPLASGQKLVKLIPHGGPPLHGAAPGPFWVRLTDAVLQRPSA